MKGAGENLKHLLFIPPNETDVSMLAVILVSSWHTEVGSSSCAKL